MTIATVSDFNSENELLNFVGAFEKRDSVNPLVENGDDASVIELSNTHLVSSCDTLVEMRHFSFQYFSGRDVGFKAIETAVSDIIAMGARPLSVQVAISMRSDTDAFLLREIFRGMFESLERVGISLGGGDITTGSENFVITVTALGAAGQKVVRRGGARPGDLVYVTGPLGGSAAGLALFLQGKNGFDDFKTKHLRPLCRAELASPLSRVAHSMIDISDGLGIDAGRVAAASGCTINIDAKSIPRSEKLCKAATIIGKDPLELVLSGGEDYELLFTTSKNAIVPVGCVEIGIVVEPSGSPCVLLVGDGKTRDISKIGFSHLR